MDRPGPTPSEIRKRRDNPQNAPTGGGPASPRRGRATRDPQRRRFEFGAATGSINVLDPQQKAPAPTTRKVGVEQGRVGVAEVEPSVGAGRKAENGLHRRIDRAMEGRPHSGVHHRMTILDSEAVLNEGRGALQPRDPVMARIIAEGAVPPLRKRDPGFEGLCRIIVSQQLSTASANAIWARIEARFPALSPAKIAAADEDLRGAGLSAPKIRTLRAIAAAIEA